MASVTGTAAGLDLVSLRSAEQGLFTEPAEPDASPPEFRLRRANGSVPEAIYAREMARGSLLRDGEAFVATVEDPALGGLVPYVRYFCWAEVRHPAQRRVPHGVHEIVLPGGAILPAQAAQREDPPAGFSLPSAPAIAVHVPAEVPAMTDADVTAGVGPGALPETFTVTVLLTGGPLASPRVQPGCTVRLPWQVGDGAWTPVPDQTEINAEKKTASFDHAGAEPATRLALIPRDPVGREAPPLKVDVARA